LIEDQEEARIRKAQTGDSRAFSELVITHQQFVYNLALRSLGDHQEAEDVSQEAFVRAWLALPNFRGKSQFRTWLYRIVINLCYNRLPRLRSELLALGDDQMVDFSSKSREDPQYRVETKERNTFLYQQIEALPESYRLLLTLRFQQELSYAEIAEVVSMPLGTVKTGIFRAREQLQEALRRFEEETI
jgi:RNA polymerase sigma-70 factor (ECF subfamily)